MDLDGLNLGCWQVWVQSNPEEKRLSAPSFLDLLFFPFRVASFLKSNL
jgi:hypothetical protein